jgi:DNA-binding GntR family transcriptional regulator
LLKHESRDAGQSREAMDAHMQQTLDDLKNLVLVAT